MTEETPTSRNVFAALQEPQTATSQSQELPVQDQVFPSLESTQIGSMDDTTNDQINTTTDNGSDRPINKEEELTGRTRIQRVKMESFIKVLGCRKVTTEILSADGEVISTDIQEVDDEPECFKISSQEKLSYGEPSTFQVQKPDNFILPYRFLKQTNFCTSITLRCPKFINDNSGDASDPVFTSLNLSKQQDSYFPDIEAIKTNVQIQMKQWKTIPEPKRAPSKKPKFTQKVAPKTIVSETSNEAVDSSADVVVIGSREGKRIRKPTKKMLEYQEREKTEAAEIYKKANNKSMTIKTEPGLLDASSKNLNSNNSNAPSKTETDQTWAAIDHPVPNLQVIKDELEAHESKLNPFSGDVIESIEPNENHPDEVDGHVLTGEEVAELLNISPLELNQVEKKEEESREDGSITIKPLMELEKKEEDNSEDDYEDKVIRPSKRFSCRHCRTNFNNRLSFSRHMYRHRKAKDIANDECKICNKTFYSRYVYECHMLKHIHETPEGKYKCLVCKKEFISRGGLLKHQRSDKDCKGTEFRCDYCGVMYNSLQTLDIHKRKYHVTLYPDTKERCDNCGKQFETKGGLSKHRRNKACETTFACESCGKTFNNATRFEKHKLTHNNNKPSTVCDVCGKSLSTAAALAVHKNSHANIRKFVCNVCNKSFLQKGTLVAHQRIHTGERPYLCNTCGASFRYNSHLIQHENLHTGKIKYPCTKCERSFYTKHSLKKHLLSHERKARLEDLKEMVPDIPLKPEELNIPDVVVGENEIVFLNEVVGEEDGETQFIYTTEDGQQCFLTNSSDAIVTSDQQIEYQDGQNIIYQTVEGDNVTFVDEMQTSDLSILAETAQNYENSGVTYVIVKK